MKGDISGRVSQMPETLTSPLMRLMSEAKRMGPSGRARCDV